MPERTRLVANKIVAVFRAAALKAEHGHEACVTWKDFTEFEDVYDAGLMTPTFSSSLNDWGPVKAEIMALQVMNFFFLYNYGVGPMTLRHLTNQILRLKDVNDRELTALGQLICQLAAKPDSELAYVEDMLIEQCEEVYKTVAPKMPSL